MHDQDTLRAALRAKPGAEETLPFDPVTLVVKVGGKMFALVPLTAFPVRLSGSPYRVPGSEGVSPLSSALRARRPRSQAAEPHTDFRDAVLVSTQHEDLSF